MYITFLSSLINYCISYSFYKYIDITLSAISPVTHSFILNLSALPNINKFPVPLPEKKHFSLKIYQMEPSPHFPILPYPPTHHHIRYQLTTPSLRITFSPTASAATNKKEISLTRAFLKPPRSPLSGCAAFINISRGRGRREFKTPSRSRRA